MALKTLIIEVTTQVTTHKSQLNDYLNQNYHYESDSVTLSAAQSAGTSSMALPGLPWTSKTSWTSWTSMDFHGLPRTSWTSKDFPWTLQTLHRRDESMIVNYSRTEGSRGSWGSLLGSSDVET